MPREVISSWVGQTSARASQLWTAPRALRSIRTVFVITVLLDSHTQRGGEGHGIERCSVQCFCFFSFVVVFILFYYHQ